MASIPIPFGERQSLVQSTPVRGFLDGIAAAAKSADAIARAAPRGRSPGTTIGGSWLLLTTKAALRDGGVNAQLASALDD